MALTGGYLMSTLRCLTKALAALADAEAFLEEAHKAIAEHRDFYDPPASDVRSAYNATYEARQRAQDLLAREVS
jgi:hypothetical protein